MSSRRSAQLGLLSVCLLVVTSLSVLVASARDTGTGFKPFPAPSFRSTDTNGSRLSSTSLKGKVTVLYFFSVRCPVCNDYTNRVLDLTRRYANDSRVQFIGVHSTAVGREVPTHEVRVQSMVSGLTFRTLDDRDGSVARTLKVARTPTVVVLDRDGMIRYQGTIDDNRSLSAVKSSWARNAIDAVLAGKPVAMPITSEIGCSIFK